MPKYMSDTEHKILRKLLEVARDNNYVPSRHNATDDGSWAAISTDEEVIEAVDSVEECSVRFKETEGEKHFSVLLILGNGTDIISDYSTRTDNFPEVDQLMDKLQGYAESLGR